MNRNQFSLLLFLVVVLGLAGLMVYNRQNAAGRSGDAARKEALPNLPLNDIAHIALKQGTNQLNLAKKDGTWRVRERNDYPANYSEISDF
jgi:hypothetical protein